MDKKFSFLPYEGDKSYIYISYSSVDSEKVFSILEKLDAVNFRIWWYKKGIQISSWWQDYNAKHIKNSEVFMIFISKTYVESGYCRDEIGYAKNYKKNIFPIYLERTPLPEGIEIQVLSNQSMFLDDYENMSDFYDEIILQEVLKPCKDSSKWIALAGNATPTNPLELALKYYAEKDFLQAAKIFEDLSNQGDAEAKRNLAWMYLNGEIAEGKLRKGVNLLQEAAKLKNGDAINQLAVLCYRGNIIKQNLKYAESFFRDAAEVGNHWGMYNLGCMYLDREIPYSEPSEGVKWLEQSAELGNGDAMNHLGGLYYAGEVVEKNFELAAKYFRDAAKVGNHWGMYNLGCMYLDGEIPNSEPFDGVKWLEQAAKLGNAKAMNHLGILNHDGNNVVEINFELAAEYFREASKAGNHWGMYNLARMYLKGEIGYVEAAGVELLHEAANFGNVKALRDLSEIYAKGKFGIKKNSALAKKLEQMARENGYELQNSADDSFSKKALMFVAGLVGVKILGRLFNSDK